MKLILFLFFGASVAPITSADSKKIICYWQRKIEASYLDPFACTHISLAFINTNATTGEVSFVHAKQEQDFKKLIQLKLKNPELKIMISLTNHFREISIKLRTEFASNLLTFLNNYEIDGADIDWEFPAYEDRKNFVLLLREVKKALKLSNKFLSIAANPCLLSDKNGYDVPAIMQEVDFSTLMLYDLQGGAWSNYTANHGNFKHTTSSYNVVKCVKTWVDAGAIREKLIIGIPTYSRNFQLDDPENYGVGALATFKDFGEPNQIPGTFSYLTICKNIKENGWRRYYDYVKSTGPYAVSGTTWAGYDDVESIKEKAIFVNEENFGGVGFWSLDHDDYLNTCGNGTFPLIKSVWNIIMRKVL